MVVHIERIDSCHGCYNNTEKYKGLTPQIWWTRGIDDKTNQTKKKLVPTAFLIIAAYIS